MRLFLLSALALVAGAVILRLLQHDAGYILIVVGGKSIEMRFWFALFFFIAIVSIVLALVRMGGRSVRWLGNGWWRMSSSRERLAERQARRGLLHYLEGDWQGACRNLVKAAQRTDFPVIHYLVAARSALAMGDSEQARTLMDKAESAAGPRTLAVVLSRAQMQLEESDLDACRTSLAQAQTIAPTSPAVMALAYKVHLLAEDWTALEPLLPQLKRHLAPSVWLDLQRRTSIGLLLKAANTGGQQRLSQLTELWRRLPKPLLTDASVLTAYCRCLLDLGQHDQVEPLLRVALKREWHDEWISLYGLTFSNPTQQRQWAEQWLQARPQDPDLRLALGRICLRNELWAQARDHFLATVKSKPTPTAYAELARLLAAMGELKQSADYAQRGLELASMRLPALPLPKAPAPVSRGFGAVPSSELRG
jgi:HemY protein